MTTTTTTSVSVHTIVTHARPHLDELAAIFAFQNFGQQQYPGVAEAKIEVFNPEKHDDGRSEEAWRQEGYLFLGVRGGEFDDHPHEQFPNDCVFTLVLKKLGLATNPEWEQLSRHILNEDRHGAPHALHLAQSIKLLHALYPVEEILAMTSKILLAHYHDQKEFVAAQKIVNQPECLTVIHHRATGEEYILCAVESDNPRVSAAARDKNGPNALLVVQRNPQNGHLYISSNKKLRMRNVGPLVSRLRQLEQTIREFEPITDPLQLAADGMCQGWYHQVDAAAAFCGSPTQPHLPGSSIPFEEIIRTAALFLERAQL